MANKELLRVANLVKHFPVGGDWFAQLFDRRLVRAVDDASFSIRRGTTLGLVGESGSGKTTLGRIITRLVRPTAGRVLFDGVDLTTLSRRRLRPWRRRVQMIFQDPSTSLNRRSTIGQIITEPLKVHREAYSGSLKSRMAEIMELTGLPARFQNRYPHELSGGQRQRVGIARALSVNPEFIVCDEPVTALDVSIQAQIINLLIALQKELGLTYLFIAHDLSIVKHVSDVIAVMYLGQIVEQADAKKLFSMPRHPYTQALMEAVPRLDPEAPKRKVLHGEVPSPITPPKGCRFHPRCPVKIGRICEEQEPPETQLADGTRVKCHLYGAEQDRKD